MAHPLAHRAPIWSHRDPIFWFLLAAAQLLFYGSSDKITADWGGREKREKRNFLMSWAAFTSQLIILRGLTMGEAVNIWTQCLARLENGFINRGSTSYMAHNDLESFMRWQIKSTYPLHLRRHLVFRPGDPVEVVSTLYYCCLLYTSPSPRDA